MEKKERNDYAIRLFTVLMKKMISPSFTFPGGGISIRSVSSCMDSLQDMSKGEISRERITDFCICQVYAIAGFEDDYSMKWKVNHSFGKKAIERFLTNNSRKRFYEDKWLISKGLSRAGLLDDFKDRKEHPLFKFIYPEYEEATKLRLHSSTVGYYICLVSTLLYTPFSAACRSCKNMEPCKRRTKGKYPELYRIRTEEYNKRGK